MKKFVLCFIAGLAYLPAVTEAALSVGPGGTGLWTFDALPLSTEWTTQTIPGGPGDIGDAASLDTAVQSLSAGGVNLTLRQTATVPPTTSAQGAFWNSNARYLQSRPAGVAFHVLLAALRNDTGSDLTSVTVAYNFGTSIQSGSTIAEDVPGLRVYLSVTGAPGTWQLIPELSMGNTGLLHAVLALGSWPPGSTLYLLWADDNGPYGTTGPYEGGYTIDDFTVSTETHFVVMSPIDGEMFRYGTPIELSALAVLTGAVNRVGFYANGSLIGEDTTEPFSLVYSDAVPGTQELFAIATDDLGQTLESRNERIQVVSNLPPLVRLSEPANGASFPVGEMITCYPTASDRDGTVVAFELHLDGALYFSYPYPNPVTLFVPDITAGAHALSVVAVDNENGRGTNTIEVVVAAPAGITFLVTNASVWKYLDDGSNQDVAWRARDFDDTGWSNGLARLGYGGEVNRRPQSTTLNSGSDPTNRHVTAYFRRNFTVGNPSVFTNLMVRLMRDDGGIVYINGVEVFRNNMPGGPIAYTTLASDFAPDDGMSYVQTNANPSVLLPGENVVAVEIHQESASSYDASFDLMLWAQPEFPSLTIQRINPTQAQLSWPASSAGYVLESSSNLDARTWHAVTNMSSVEAAFRQVVLDLLPGPAFYRLRR